MLYFPVFVAFLVTAVSGLHALFLTARLGFAAVAGKSDSLVDAAGLPPMGDWESEEDKRPEPAGKEELPGEEGGDEIARAV
jgi:hypothetical protein